MVTTALGATILPLLGAAGALGCASLWAARWPAVSFIFLSLTVVLGQTVRFPLPGQGGGLLVSDIAVLLVIWAAIWQRPTHTSGSAGAKALADKPARFVAPARRSLLKRAKAGAPVAQGHWKLLLLFCPFIFWSIGSLGISTIPLSGPDVLVASAYWVRLTTHLLLIPALLLLCRTARQQTYLARTLVATTATLATVGLIQLLVFPRLQLLPGGWDPHVYRLVATWLDPNLIGGFFAIVLPWLTARSVSTRKYRAAHLVLIAVVIVALLLTRSRSSLVALAVGVTVVSPLVVGLFARHAPRRGVGLVAIGSSLGILVVSGIWLLGDRAWGLVTFDQTVTLRLQSLAATWPLVIDHGIIGVGYNAYQFAAQQAGLISDFTVHSRAGVDNSWLTLIITTGIVGLALFVAPWLWIMRQQLYAVVGHRNYQALAGLTAVTIWLAHSQFVNSLFYSHLLITVAMLIAVTWPTKVHDTNHTEFLSASSPDKGRRGGVIAAKPPVSPLSGGRD